MKHLARLALAFAALTPALVSAQDYPTRPIRIVVPYAPGGTDQQVRLMAPVLQRLIGQSLVIENIAGGGTIIGSTTVLKSAPDGHTLLYTGTGGMTVIPNITKVPFTRADFIPLGNVIGTPFVVAARGDAPFRTLADMVAFARANPGKLSFGSAGAGTTTHMAGEAMAAAGRFSILHVPYQGIGPAVQSILGGNVDLVVGLPNAIMPHVTAGKLIGLAITGPQRSELLAGLPPLREGGIDMVDVSKFGFFAPKGVPEAVVRKWVAAIPEAMKAPEFIEATRKSYNAMMYMDPEQFRTALDAEDRHFKKLITDLKLAEPGK
jgi:tripartite-type tricarboxylate transporter receptor subunit TctC